MTHLEIQDGRDVEFILKIKAGEIVHCNLEGLYLINKYGGDPVLLNVTLPATIDIEGEEIPERKFRLILDDGKHECQHGVTCNR